MPAETLETAIWLSTKSIAQRRARERQAVRVR